MILGQANTISTARILPSHPRPHATSRSPSARAWGQKYARQVPACLPIFALTVSMRWAAVYDHSRSCGQETRASKTSAVYAVREWVSMGVCAGVVETHGVQGNRPSVGRRGSAARRR